MVKETGRVISPVRTHSRAVQLSSIKRASQKFKYSLSEAVIQKFHVSKVTI